MRGSGASRDDGNIDDALDAYRLLSSIGVHSFRTKPMFASGVALVNEDALVGSADEIRDLQEALMGIAAQPSSARLELPPPSFVDTSQLRPNVRCTECDCDATAVYLSTNGHLYPVLSSSGILIAASSSSAISDRRNSTWRRFGVPRRL